MSNWKAKSVEDSGDVKKESSVRGKANQAIKDAMDSAREHMKGERFDDAQEAFEAIIEKSPGTVPAYLGLGNVFAAKGEYEEALARYAGALEIKSDLSQALMMSGNVYAKMGRTTEALEKFDEAIVLNPDLEKASVGAAMIHAKKGRYDNAISIMKEALRYNPQSENVLLGLAGMYQREGDVDAAYKVFNSLVTYSPQSWKGCFQLGRLHLSQKKYDEAIMLCKKSIKLNPDDSASRRCLLGGAYAAAGQYESALKEYKVALESDETLVSARVGMARVYREQGELSDAKQILISLCRGKVNQGYIHLQLAEIMAIEGHYGLAVDQYQAAILNGEKMVEKYPHLAEVEVVEGDDEKTVEAFAKAFGSIDLEGVEESKLQ